MSLRRRLTAMSGLIVLVTLAVCSAGCYAAMSHTLHAQVDQALSVQTRRVDHLQPGGPANSLPNLPGPAPRSDLSAGFIQIVRPNGQVVFHSNIALPVSPTDRAIAASGGGPVEYDATADAMPVRVLTEALPGREGAIQVAYSLVRVNSTLSELRYVLMMLVFGGTALAVLFTRAFARTTIAPITELTVAAEHIERTGDLDRRVSSSETEEVGRLARRFNAMLDRVQDSQEALQASITAQRQLVADASHELRTPIASVRTNIEVLRENADLPAGMRDELLDDVVEQTEELSQLVTDLIELARGHEPDSVLEDVSLDAVVTESLERARRHHPDVSFEASVTPCELTGNAARLSRAVNNLLDNAAKFSGVDAVVEVTLTDRRLSVRDHGPGVSPDELDRLFDRFYRATNAATYEGSGLGLAIVKQVADSHGATVNADLPAGGGLRIRLQFPADTPVD